MTAKGKCSASSTSQIKLFKADNGRIETEFEVDQNRVGANWNVKDSGVVVARTTATTTAPSGSFTVRRLIPNRAGTDRVTGFARGTWRPAETCSATASSVARQLAPRRGRVGSFGAPPVCTPGPPGTLAEVGEKRGLSRSAGGYRAPVEGPKCENGSSHMRPMIRRGGVALATSPGRVVRFPGSQAPRRPAVVLGKQSPPASPPPVPVLNYWVDATTTLKKLKQTVIKVPAARSSAATIDDVLPHGVTFAATGEGRRSRWPAFRSLTHVQDDGAKPVTGPPTSNDDDRHGNVGGQPSRS